MQPGGTAGRVWAMDAGSSLESPLTPRLSTRLPWTPKHSTRLGLQPVRARLLPRCCSGAQVHDAYWLIRPSASSSGECTSHGTSDRRPRTQLSSSVDRRATTARLAGPIAVFRHTHSTCAQRNLAAAPSLIALHKGHSSISQTGVKNIPLRRASTLDFNHYNAVLLAITPVEYRSAASLSLRAAKNSRRPTVVGANVWLASRVFRSPFAHSSINNTSCSIYHLSKGVVLIS
jgi:hypothetical protein